jgi:hypothetical protein
MNNKDSKGNKNEKMKKAIVVLGLGLGLSDMFSGVASAMPNRDSCDSLYQHRLQGDINACGFWGVYQC